MINRFEFVMFTVMRTESPDNDSAFSDSISLISSESSTSSSTALSTRTNQVRRLFFLSLFRSLPNENYSPFVPCSPPVVAPS